MSSVELCPGLQYPFLKSPSWHCRSGLCGPLLLTNTLLLLKTEVLTAVVTTPSHYFCLWSPPFIPQNRKTETQVHLLSFGSDVDFLERKWMCSQKLSERHGFSFLWFAGICKLKIFLQSSWANRCKCLDTAGDVLGSTTRSSVMLAQFKINQSNKHGIIQRIDPFTCLRRAHASSQAVSTCKIPLYYCY